MRENAEGAIQGHFGGVVGSSSSSFVHSFIHSFLHLLPPSPSSSPLSFHLHFHPYVHSVSLRLLSLERAPPSSIPKITHRDDPLLELLRPLLFPSLPPLLRIRWDRPELRRPPEAGALVWQCACSRRRLRGWPVNFHGRVHHRRLSLDRIAGMRFLLSRDRQTAMLRVERLRPPIASRSDIHLFLFFQQNPVNAEACALRSAAPASAPHADHRRRPCGAPPPWRGTDAPLPSRCSRSSTRCYCRCTRISFPHSQA